MAADDFDVLDLAVPRNHHLKHLPKERAFPAVGVVNDDVRPGRRRRFAWLTADFVVFLVLRECPGCTHCQAGGGF